MPGKGFAKGGERARPDIAEDHADRTDRKLQLAVAMVAVAVMARIGGERGATRTARRLLRLSSHGAPLDERAEEQQGRSRPRRLFGRQPRPHRPARKSGGEGKSGTVRVDLGGRRFIKKKTKQK